jgi:hypothetical protein
MTSYRLKFKLLSEATFGRGDGVAGLVDTEIQHDEYGLPYLGGKTLRGLLNYECADILFALDLQHQKMAWLEATQRLFGTSGSTQEQAIMRVSDARLPQDLRQEVKIAIDEDQENINRSDILASLTTIRRQTAVDESSSAPQEGSLRSERVILSQTSFEAELYFDQEPTDKDLALLAACVKAFRRAGTGRNRGRGELKAELYDPTGQPVTDKHFGDFAREVRG